MKTKFKPDHGLSIPHVRRNDGLTIPSSVDAWTNQRVGDLVARTQQRNPAASPEKKFTYIDVSAVSNTSFRITEPAELLGSEAPSRARKVVHADDVLFATVRPTLRRVALVPRHLHDEIASTGYIVLRAIPQKLDARYLYFRLLTDEFIARMRELERGASYPAVRDSDVLNEVIPIPPLSEQRKIAGVLGLVHQAMEEQERMLALMTELKKTILHQIFTRGTRGERQRETEIGLVPESWHLGPLGDYLTESQYGISAKGGAVGKYALLRMTNQQDGRVSAEKLQFVTLTQPQYHKFRVAKLDILFNRTNSHELVGRTALFDLEGDFTFASYLIRLRTNSARLRPRYLNQYFNWHETQARLKSIAARAISQSNISATRLRGFFVPIPSVEEQDSIVNDIECIDRKLASHRRKQTILADLFRSLLHQLMTGQIRVHDLDLPKLESAAAA